MEVVTTIGVFRDPDVVLSAVVGVAEVAAVDLVDFTGTAVMSVVREGVV